MRLDVADLEPLAVGCGILGGGGGGDPLIGVFMASAAFRDFGAPDLIHPSDLPADGLVVPCGIVGAPTVMTERIPSGTEGARLVAEVEAITGRSVVALMPFEIGGLNGVLPLAWASRLRLPVVDADGMGRAFPMLDQITMNLAGRSASPCVLADERGTTLTLRAESAERLEQVLRPIVAVLGGACAAALYVLRGREVEDSCIHGSISRALALGRAVESAETDPADAVLRVLGGNELVAGKIVDVMRETSAGFVRGYAIVERSENQSGPIGGLVRLEIQNENLAALEEGEVLGCTPDVISVLDAHTGRAIGTERLRYGQRVRVIAFAGDPRWLTPDGLAAAGPVAFGYEFPYRAISRLSPIVDMAWGK